jgi:hypothetical protein
LLSAGSPRIKQGDKAGDISAAKTIQANIGDDFARYIAFGRDQYRILNAPCITRKLVAQISSDGSQKMV